MTHFRPPRSPRRRWLEHAALLGGVLFVSGFLEAVFAQSVVLLTIFVAYLLVASLVLHLFGPWR